MKDILRINNNTRFLSMEQNYILIAKKEDIYIPSFIIDNYSKRILKRISNNYKRDYALPFVE